jgi:hypothetical protein
MSKILMSAAAVAMLVGVSAANAQGTTQTEIDNGNKGAPKTQNNVTTTAPAKDSTKTTGAVNSNQASPSGTDQTSKGSMNNPPAGIAKSSPEGGSK